MTRVAGVANTETKGSFGELLERCKSSSAIISAGSFYVFMLKRDELTNPESCLNIAKENERLFVLLARDITAPATIRFWISERLRTGRNKPQDDQILQAEMCARFMEQEQPEFKPRT